jgi:ribosomal protein S18 acetylase RimI-like enzyme
MAELSRAEPGDADAIADLVQRAYAHYPERIGVRPAPMDADYAAAVRENEVWVAERGEAIVGVVVLRHDAGHAFVDNVAVAPDAQGEGLGGRLLALAESRAAAAGHAEVRLLTNELMHENRAMYQHLGWRQTELRREHGFSRVYFAKALGRAGP